MVTSILVSTERFVPIFILLLVTKKGCFNVLILRLRQRDEHDNNNSMIDNNAFILHSLIHRTDSIYSILTLISYHNNITII